MSAVWDLEDVLVRAGVADADCVLVVRASRLGLGTLIVPTATVVLRLDDVVGDDLLAGVLRRYPDGALVCIVSGDGVRRVSCGGLAAGDLGDAEAVVFGAVALHELEYAVDGVRGVIDRLRDPVDGCPWDNAQTHLSLRPHLLEETYEALEAIGSGDASALAEELGDVLMQVVLHAKLAEQEGAFDLDDVAEGIRAKLIRRHPHVFGAGGSAESAGSAEWVEGVWERLKARERPSRESVLDGIPKALPALARAQSILGRAERNGFVAPSGVAGDDVGGRALELVREARRAGVQAEDALRDAVAEFERRLRSVEASLRRDGRVLSDADSGELERLWEAASEAGE